MNERLAAGTYTGKNDSDEKCTVKIETATDRAGKIDDYNAVVTVFYGEKGEKKDMDSFNLFNDGRDFSESYVVDIALSRASSKAYN